MPLDERMLEQNDPNIDPIAHVQRSITATLTYIMGRASVAELFGLQAYVSKLAAQMAPVEAVRHGPEAPWDENLWEQELEKRRQQAMYQKALAQQALGHYRPEN